MKRAWKGYAAVAVAAALLTCLAMTPVANATVMRELSMEELVDGADAIARARVTRSGTVLSLDANGHYQPFTRTEMEVSEWLKGESDALVLRELGGLIGQNGEHGGMAIDGTPTYSLGEEVVVFLRHDPEEVGAFRTFGMVQGKFGVVQTLEGPSYVERDTRDVAFLSNGRWRQQIQHGSTERIALDVFLEFIRTELENPRVNIEGEGEVTP